MEKRIARKINREIAYSVGPYLQACHINHWETQLESLTVQNKVLTLEQRRPLYRGGG